MHPQHHRQRVRRPTLAAARVERGPSRPPAPPTESRHPCAPGTARGAWSFASGYIPVRAKVGCVSMSSSSPSCKLYNYNMLHPQSRLIQTFPRTQTGSFVGDPRLLVPRRDDFADELAAMANGFGGAVVLGVDDQSREISGIPINPIGHG